MRWQLKPESEKMLHLDCLRLIAATGIVLLHGVGRLEGLQLDLGSFRLFVDLISGYVISFVYMDGMCDREAYKGFLWKRVARLVPLHWATFALFMVLGILVMVLHVPINHAEIYDMRCAAQNFLLLHAAWTCPHVSFNEASWTISAEMGMYLISPLAFWLARRSSAAMILIIGAMWLGMAQHSTPDDPLFYRTSEGGVLRALPSFLLGVWLYQNRKRFIFSGASRLMWFSLAAFVVCGLGGLAPHYLVLILYATATFAICARKGRVSRLTRMGAAWAQLTYSSYMLHGFVFIAVVSFGADHFLHANGAAKNALVVLAFFIVWIVSWVSFVMFERPIRRLLTAPVPQPA